MMSLVPIGSLVFGLLAWILPIINLVRIKRNQVKNWYVFSSASLIACSIALYFEILYSEYLVVDRKDLSALMDIVPVVAMLSAVLLGITIALNIITIIVYRYSREA